MSTLREQIARIFDEAASEAAAEGIAAGVEYLGGKYYADRVLALLPLQPEGEVVEALVTTAVHNEFQFSPYNLGAVAHMDFARRVGRRASEAYAKREGEEQGASCSKTAAEGETSRG